MKICVIGNDKASDNVIKEMALKRGYDISFTPDVTSFSSLKKATEAALGCDVLIIYIFSLSMADDDFYEGVRYIKENYNGFVIIMAPGASYSDLRVNICEEVGYEYVIRDILASRINLNLDKVFQEISSRPTNSPAISGGDISHNNQSNHIDKQNKYENNDTNFSNVSYVATKKVGVIGVLPRIGVTTQALMILNTLRGQNEQACYIQYHDSPFLNNMENFFSGVKKNSNGCIEYEGIDFYKNPNLVLSKNYKYHIKDYGACVGSQVPTDFFNNDIRFIVCGGTAEEVSSLTALRTQLFMDNELIFVFSFIADYEREDIIDLMGGKQNKVIFAPYTPDCYRITEEAKQLYLPIFGFETEEKKKKTFGFMKRKR